MEIKDFKVGQKVLVKIVGNEARHRKPENLIEEWEIIQVGRKYITAKSLDSFGQCQFEKSTATSCYGRFVQKTDYCVDYIMYMDMQDIKNEEKRREKEKIITGYFRSRYYLPKLSDSELETIYDIIKTKE